MDHLREFVGRYQLDVAALQEHGLNLQNIPRCKRFDYLLRSENQVRVMADHNAHENNGNRRQWGGTALLSFGETSTRISEMGSDPSGLGRWTWMRFVGKNGVTTRVISAYQPCPAQHSHLWTVYCQHRTYLRSKGDFTCPRKAMVRDLELALRKWRNDGERIVLCMDMNDDMTNSPMQRMLSSEGLDLREAAMSRHPHLPKTPTYMKGERVGKNPIDGIWLSPDLPDLRSGWLAFQKSLDDHRNPIVDINTKALFGENLLKIVRPPARRLACNIPKALENYDKRLCSHAKTHKILPKLHQVYGSSTNLLSPKQETTLESIDRVRHEGMAHAEKRCRKLAMGEVDCSPSIMKARQVVKLWRGILRKKRGRQVSSSWIKRKARRCGVTNPLSCSLREAERNYKRALDEYNELKPRAKKLRREYLYDKAHDYSDDSDENARKHAKRLLREEQQREAARMIRRVLGKTKAGSVDWVETEENGEAVRYHDKATVEEKIMENNEKRFRLTESTPPMCSPLKEDLGFLGATEAAKRILNGTYVCPPGVDEITADFLTSLRVSSPNIDSIPTSVTKEDYQRYWKRAKEKTSSSISGLHFGHWKACSHNDYLSEIHAIFTEIVVTTGFSPSRWQQGLSVMLEKVEGVRRLDKLRAILLMEADYNFANSLFLGKRMVDRAEELGEIPAECFARKGHQAIDVAINRCLTMDNVRQKKIPASISAVDAQTCYDRITHSIASICAQRLGMVMETITSLFLTIQLMRFFLRTAYGDSDSYYGGSRRQSTTENGTATTPFQGACQGNGGAPGVWLIVSSVLVKMMHANGHVSFLTRAVSGLRVCFTGFLYVDDTDLIVIAKSRRDTVGNVIDRSQATASQWAGGLRATGGALKPEKCSWCLIDFIWINGRWKYRSKGGMEGTLKIPGLDGQMVEIERLEPWDPIKVVGVVQAADGSMDGQFAELMERIDDLGGKLRDGCIPRKMTWQGFNSSIWNSIKYPLPACNFSKKEADQLTVRLYKHTLPSLGASKSFPNVYRYAPKTLQGLEAPNFYVEMNVDKTGKVLVHGDTLSLTGQLFGSSLEQAQIEMGSGTPFFLADYERYGCLVTDIWIKGLWEFLSAHDIKLECVEFPLPKLQREHDEFIMDKLVRLDKMDDKALAAFNRCRIKMEALTMADIIEGNGTKLRWDVNAWTPDQEYFCSTYEWPNEHPSNDDWNIWRHGLKLLTSQNESLDFFETLGDWVAEPHKIWEWHFSPSENRLYGCLQSGDRWFCYKPIHNTNTRQPRFVRDRLSQGLPRDACVATARRSRRGFIRLHGWADKRIENRPPPTSVRELIDRWHANWPLEICDLAQAEGVAQSIRNGDALAVCDGSYKAAENPELGTAAWIIEATDGSFVKGVVQTSGRPSEVNAYRSELQGIHTTLMALKALCEFYDIKSGKVLLGCDNEKGVYLSSSKWVQVPLRTKHADLIRAIRKLAQSLPIEVNFQHVDGHQDKEKDFAELSRLSQLNVLMDHQAKLYLRHLLDLQYPPKTPSDIYFEGWRCRVNGVKVTSDPGDAIRCKVYADDIRDYLQKHKGLDSNKFDCVDWEANGDALRSAPTLFSLWLTKHVSGCCGIGKMMCRWKLWENAKCMSCDEEVEDIPHLYFCPHEDRVDAWEDAVEGFDGWLEAVDTDPSIRSCLVRALSARRPDQRFAEVADESVMEAALEQDEIGWTNFVEGRVSRKWREIQQDRYLLQGSQRTAKRWAEDLVMNLFSLVHKQWMARNAVVHGRDDKGLKIKEGKELQEAIEEQFELGEDGLCPTDQHFITRGRETVERMSGAEQKTWLHGIRIAREVYEMELDTEITQMRDSMYGWLRRL